LVVGGFSLAYLGLGTIAALGTDLVVGAAPPDKAGSASAMSETAQELGVALGVALVGSLSTAVYRLRRDGLMAAVLPDDVRAVLADSLWAATAAADRLPADALEHARTAFVAGFNVAALACAITALLLAALAAVTLRRVGSIGTDENGDVAASGERACCAST